MPALVVRDVAKSFGRVQALDRLSLTVHDGRVVAVLGPSGCGKTTLLRIVAGLLEPDAGQVQIGGRDVTALPAGKRAIGMVFQEPAAFPYLSVADNLAFGLRVRGLSRGDRVRRVTDVAQRLGIADLLARRPAQLSGGERQRVELGRALLRDPDVLLLDEPLGSLDANLRAELRDEFRRVQTEAALTTVLVTHDQAEATVVGDDVAVMCDGRIVQVGTPEKVFDEPADLFVASFIGTPSMNLLRVHPTLLGLSAPPIASAVITGIRPTDIELIHRDAYDAILVDLLAVDDYGADLVLRTNVRVSAEYGDLPLQIRTPRPLPEGLGKTFGLRIRRWHVFAANTRRRLFSGTATAVTGLPTPRES